MDTALVLSRLLLAAVFALAGVMKLLDREGSRQAVVGFGVPASLALPVAIGLPIAEIAVAVMLLIKPAAWWGALGALALLLAFIVGIAINMAKGNHPDCHCFGQLHSEPAGWPTLIRNSILGAIALFVVATGRDLFSFSNEDAGYSAFAWLGRLTAWELVVTIVGALAIVAIAAEGWLLVQIFGQNGRMLLRLDALETMINEGKAAKPEMRTAPASALEEKSGLPEGTPAPSFSLEDLAGETVTLDSLRADGKPVLLIFADPNCGPCNTLFPDVAKWQREHGSQLTIAVISRGAAEANRNKATQHGISRILLQKDREVAQAYKSSGTPSAVLIRPDGTIGSEMAGGAIAVRQLVSKIVADLAAAPAAANAQSNGGQEPVRAVAPANGAAEPPRLKPGDAAPNFSLPDLEGKTVSLSDFKGSKTLLLFFSPHCGFCRRMLNDLKAWEENPPADAPKLLIISRGTAEEHKELGLRSTILLDNVMGIGRVFGSTGTPTGVLIDAEGKIASDLAVGARAVMALARGEELPAPGDNGAVPVQVARKGDPAPEVVLTDLDGGTFKLSEQRGKSTLLVFWNPDCGFCKRLYPDLKAWEENPPADAPQVVIVSRGTVEANRELGFRSTIVLDQGFQTGRQFGAAGTPAAVIIDAEGKVATDVAAGLTAVSALILGKDPKEAATAPRPAPVKVARKGEPAPEVILKDLDDKTFKLSEQRGTPTALLFWNPGCRFCQRMLNDLKALEANPPAGAPRIVIVSTGTKEANRELGLTSRIILDEGFQTGRQFGAGGTPSAVLIDENGTIASDVAVGAPGVLALIGAPTGQSASPSR